MRQAFHSLKNRMSELLNGDYYVGDFDTVFVNKKMIEFYKRMILCHENRIKERLKRNENKQ